MFVDALPLVVLGERTADVVVHDGAVVEVGVADGAVVEVVVPDGAGG